MLVGPEAHALFFLAQDEVLSQREVYGFTVPVFGKGIVYDAPLKLMTQQLKFVSKGLTGSHMQAHCGKIVKVFSLPCPFETLPRLPPSGPNTHNATYTLTHALTHMYTHARTYKTSLRRRPRNSLTSGATKARSTS
jgi:hypothetical protein